MGDQKLLENHWQQAFEQGEWCSDCHFCVSINNVHPYGETHCVESCRDCSVRDIKDCPAVQASLGDND